MATEILVTGASGIFDGATLSSSFSGVIVAETEAVVGDFTANGGEGDGSEVAFNIIDHLHTQIAAQTAQAAGADNIRTSSTQTLNGTTLTKNYTFSFDLSFTDASSLNVKDE